LISLWGLHKDRPTEHRYESYSQAAKVDVSLA